MVKRRLTEREQGNLLDDFYSEIYAADNNFHGANNRQFEGEGNRSDDDDGREGEDADIQFDANVIDDIVDDVVDENLDTDIPEDERDDEVTLPRKQKFRSQKDVCDERNYEKLPEQDLQMFQWSNKNGDTVDWTTRKPTADVNPTNRGRRPAKDLPRPGGPTRYAKLNSRTLTKTWQLTMTDDILMKVVSRTNKKITEFCDINRDALQVNDKKTQYKLTSLVELKAWFGIMYLRGALHLNGTDTDTVFHHESCNDFFTATMQRKRYTFLNNVIQFDDSDTRNQRWKEDKFACFREYFEAINNRFLLLRHPSEHTAIDETLYPYRGRVGFKQYNPKKPAKYGLLFRSLCDSTCQYTYFSLPYAGKPEEGANEYYVTKTDNYTKYLVENTIRIAGTASLRGRNISLDRYFTSLTIADWLLEKDITITGTLRKDRIGLPRELKIEAGREPKSTMWCYNGKKMLISYADKKKKGTKVVMALSTMHDEMRISKDERKKPEPIVYYDHMKGGVDIVDLLSTMLSTRCKTRRWPCNANFFILDTVRTNTRTLYNECNKEKLSNFEFTWQLAKELVSPLIQQRYEAGTGLQASVKQKMRKVLGLNIIAAPAPAPAPAVAPDVVAPNVAAHMFLLSLPYRMMPFVVLAINADRRYMVRITRT